MDHQFKQYQRSQIGELRPYVPGEALPANVSISDADKHAGSPKAGDMIARNPKNNDDQWLVAAAYFAANFTSMDPDGAFDFGQAIKHLRMGKRVQRAGWNGKGMWLALVPGDRWGIGDVPVFDNVLGPGTALPWIAMKTADNKVVPWLASQTDVLATDWSLVSA